MLWQLENSWKLASLHSIVSYITANEQQCLFTSFRFAPDGIRHKLASTTHSLLKWAMTAL